MKTIDPKSGISTLVNHVDEGIDPLHAHSMPIYQTSTFTFDNTEAGARLFRHEGDGYVYTRWGNPNLDHLAAKYAALEGLDLWRKQPDVSISKIVAGKVFASGMAAITTAILARVKAGQTIIVHESLYSATFTFLREMAPDYGINVVWTKGVRLEDWQQAFDDAPDAVLAYVESPANPVLSLVDIAGVAEIAHQHGAWLMVDNTFASPYCQRPLTLGADVVVHSTTKYLSGHGLLIGGAVVSVHPDFISGELDKRTRLLGGVPGPFDAWLANVGLKTFELRMKAHCNNAQRIAEYLESHPRVERVYYPGLPSHPDYSLAQRQMLAGGGMIAFELKGGYNAGEAMMNRVKVATLATSLGNTDTLISHPASTSHVSVPAKIRKKNGISDGLVRLSVGIENVEDLIADLDQALE